MASTGDRIRTAVVIGGGPGGLMAAEVLATAGWQVDLHDRMPSMGRKFLLAGRGGLNLTHSEPLEHFITRYGTGAGRLRAAITAFPPAAVIDWVEGLGEPTFIGTSGRVFPESMKASPLLRAWLRRLDGLGVRFHSRSRWEGWEETGALRFSATDGITIVPRPDATFLALGGASWPRMGSDGAWVPVLSDAGVAVIPLEPTNAGFSVAWSDIFRDRSAGEPLKRVAVSFEGVTVRGEVVITKAGLEGGAIYALGRALRERLAGGPVEITIDLRPDLEAETLVKALARARKGDSMSNMLRKAAGLTPAAIGLLREAHGRTLPDNPFALAAAIKAVPVALSGIGSLERAISTAGGVSLADLDDGFMLKARPGTYVIGEMLDWEAPTGGYLLQATLSTAVAAARQAIAAM